MEILIGTWEKWKFKYLTVFCVSIVIALILATNQSFKEYLLHLGSREYVGVLIAGILFVFSFTIPIAIVLIGILAQDLNPLAIGLIGGIGSVIGDLIIFRIAKDHFAQELGYLVGKEEKMQLKHVMKSKYVAWTLPIIGGLIIASPLPDELGVSLLGLSAMSETKLIIISYISNATGILMIASVAKVL